MVWPKGTFLWRAMSIHDLDLDIFQDSNGNLCVEDARKKALSRLIPLGHRAKEGRANPKGIRHLYCSTDSKTSMAELRPWIGEKLAVGELALVRELKLVDCTLELSDELAYSSDGPPNREEAHLWQKINSAYSEPVVRDEQVADYAPTQVLAEAFKEERYDGIIYMSRLGDGKNVALFDHLAATPTDTCLRFEVKDLRYAISEIQWPTVPFAGCTEPADDTPEDET